MLVQKLLPSCRKRLVTIGADAALVRAAELLSAVVDIVVVCDSAGCLAGVVTKTDVVRRIRNCQGASCRTELATVMTREAVCCRPEDMVHDVWSAMRQRRLRNIPVTDADRRPLGVLTAGDALQSLLKEAEDEKALLRDYVMCVGYR
jgi:CBS domain-containing protein